ncbi:hypothetical protein MMC08_001760 [Hypocenomyce scalaris]|nr:hypothetical protein [Hypocenomyce scalaris]
MTPTGFSSSRAALLTKGDSSNSLPRPSKKARAACLALGAKDGAYHCTGALCYEIDGQPFGLAVVSYSVAATIPMPQSRLFSYVRCRNRVSNMTLEGARASWLCRPMMRGRGLKRSRNRDAVRATGRVREDKSGGEKEDITGAPFGVEVGVVGHKVWIRPYSGHSNLKSKI